MEICCMLRRRVITRRTSVNLVAAHRPLTRLICFAELDISHSWSQKSTQTPVLQGDFESARVLSDGEGNLVQMAGTIG